MESMESNTCPMKVKAMAVTLAHMYNNPTDASSATGKEHSTLATIVQGTITNTNKKDRLSNDKQKEKGKE